MDDKGKTSRVNNRAMGEKIIINEKTYDIMGCMYSERAWIHEGDKIAISEVS